MSARKLKLPRKEDEIYCICRKPERGKMIECDYCDEWFHLDCAGIKGKIEDPQWYCFVCARVLKSEETLRNLLTQASKEDLRLKKNEHLSEELTKNDTQKQRLLEELRQIQMENEHFRKELKENDVQKQKMDEELRHIKMENNHLSEELKKNDSQKQRLLEELSQMKIENERFSKELRESDLHKLKMDEEFQQMKAENECLKKQLTDASNEVTELKKEKKLSQKRRLSYSQQQSQKQKTGKLKKYIDDDDE